MHHGNIKKREPFGLVCRMMDFFNLYIMHRSQTMQTSEILANEMYTCLFLICLDIMTFIYSDVKIVIQTYRSRRQVRILSTLLYIWRLYSYLFKNGE